MHIVPFGLKIEAEKKGFKAEHFEHWTCMYCGCLIDHKYILEHRKRCKR